MRFELTMTEANRVTACRNTPTLPPQHYMVLGERIELSLHDYQS